MIEADCTARRDPAELGRREEVTFRAVLERNVCRKPALHFTLYRAYAVSVLEASTRRGAESNGRRVTASRATRCWRALVRTGVLP